MMTDGLRVSGARGYWRLTALICGSLLAVGFGAPAVLAQKTEQVTLRLDWVPGADHTAIYLAKERGYYKDAGIDLEIRNGTGSVATIQSVAAGNDVIGLASLSQVALAIGKGVPLISILGIVQKAPDAVVALRTSGIVKPKDIEGKRWGFIPADSGARIFPAFAAANGINLDSITKVQVSYSTLYPALLQGNVDFITAWASPDAFKIAKFKPIEPPIIFADYGVNALGTGAFVTRETAKNEKLMRAFVAATLHGAAETAKNPKDALDAIMKESPTTDRAILEEEYSHLHEFLHTKNSAGHVYGWMAPADWEQTVEILKKYFDLPADTKPDTLYTDAFFPNE
jgi:NitT/TauT family transport system substrate-binding protein